MQACATSQMKFHGLFGTCDGRTGVGSGTTCCRATVLGATVGSGGYCDGEVTNAGHVVAVAG